MRTEGTFNLPDNATVQYSDPVTLRGTANLSLEFSGAGPMVELESTLDGNHWQPVPASPNGIGWNNPRAFFEGDAVLSVYVGSCNGAPRQYRLKATSDPTIQAGSVTVGFILTD